MLSVFDRCVGDLSALSEAPAAPDEQDALYLLSTSANGVILCYDLLFGLCQGSGDGPRCFAPVAARLAVRRDAVLSEMPDALPEGSSDNTQAFYTSLREALFDPQIDCPEDVEAQGDGACAVASEVAALVQIEALERLFAAAEDGVERP